MEENEDLNHQTEKLEARVKELEDQLYKNSRNSKAVELIEDVYGFSLSEATVFKLYL